MIIGRFEHQGKPVYGVVEGDMVWAVEGSVFEKPARGEAIGQFSELRVLVPCEPPKILGLGQNYRMTGRTPDKEPQFFVRVHTTLNGCDDPIVLPWISQSVAYEPELAVVIGRKAKDVPVDSALSYVFGYTCANDLTEKGHQEERLRATRSKNFDTFCPLGPVIVTDLDANDLAICARVNGDVQVSSRTSGMICKVPEIVSYMSCLMTLLPGDVILTSAPGAGKLQPGDVVEVEIEGIGMLRNPVVGSKGEPVRWQLS